MFKNFNPHSHAGSDWRWYKCQYQKSNFNPHSHAGSDSPCIRPCCQLRKFQSTLPRREWHWRRGVPSGRNHFNPHSHAGSDETGKSRHCGNGISIHTPTQGVTGQGWNYWQYYHDFNPHSHAGSDQVPIQWPLLFLISIHTPTQGVTAIAINRFICVKFQSTLPRREWPARYQIETMAIAFQSTLPRREWRDAISELNIGYWFQSTLPRREWHQV